MIHARIFIDVNVFNSEELLLIRTVVEKCAIKHGSDTLKIVEMKLLRWMDGAYRDEFYLGMVSGVHVKEYSLLSALVHCKPYNTLLPSRDDIKSTCRNFLICIYLIRNFHARHGRRMKQFGL